MNPEPAGTVNGYWMPTIVVDKSNDFERQRLLNAFQRQNIDGRVFFWPLSSLSMFEKVAGNESAYGLFERAVNLPTYHEITESDLLRVVEIVIDNLVMSG